MDAQIGKPQTIYVQVQDRANHKFKTLTVYGATHAEVLRAVKKTFGAKQSKRGRR